MAFRTELGNVGAVVVQRTVEDAPKQQDVIAQEDVATRVAEVVEALVSAVADITVRGPLEGATVIQRLTLESDIKEITDSLKAVSLLISLGFPVETVPVDIDDTNFRELTVVADKNIAVRLHCKIGKIHMPKQSASLDIVIIKKVLSEYFKAILPFERFKLGEDGTYDLDLSRSATFVKLIRRQIVSIVD